MAEPVPERLTRLLALVAYLGERPGAPVREVAAHFGVSEAQVLADVDLLWVSGTPGYLPQDLIDFSAEALDHGVLTLTEPQGMDRPLRLSTSEALALLLALRSLRAALGEDPAALPPALETALEKLTALTGEVRTAVTQAASPARASAHLDVLRGALERGRRLRLRYVSAADVVTDRDVDPVELHSDGAHWHLRAWCHRAGAPRTFRLDRVLEARELAEPAAAHPDLAWEPPGAGARAEEVTLHLASAARWVSEHLPPESVLAREDLEDGTHRLTTRVADRAWLTNLILALGEDVLAVRPPEAAYEVAARARRALAEYERLGSAAGPGST